MNIEPAYVTFEQARLLKEKGFDVKCEYKYYLDKNGDEITDEFIYNKFNNNVPTSIDIAKSVWAVSFISKPEQWKVIEWLRIKHGIWVGVYKQDTFTNVFHYKIQCDKGKNSIKGKFYDSPQKAYSTAFNYILKNLL